MGNIESDTALMRITSIRLSKATCFKRDFLWWSSRQTTKQNPETASAYNSSSSDLRHSPQRPLFLIVPKQIHQIGILIVDNVV